VTSLGYAIGLALLWVLLWGSASAANVLSGLSVGLLLAVVVPDLRRRNRWPTVRPIPLAKLVVVMLIGIVRANVVLTREIITPRSQLRTGVVGVALPTCSDELVTLITNLLGTVPGTMPLELMEDPRVLYVHVLHLNDADRLRADVVRLTGLAVRAFGSNEAITELDTMAERTATR